MGKNSRQRHRAKQKAAAHVGRRRRPVDAGGNGEASADFSAAHIPSQRQIAEQIISEAIQARHRRHAGDLKRCRILLADGTGGAVGVQVVNRALFTVLLREVDDVFTQQFPELTSKEMRVSNREGWVSGRAAADRATLQGRQAAAR